MNINFLISYGFSSLEATMELLKIVSSSVTSTKSPHCIFNLCFSDDILHNKIRICGGTTIF
jgi:hypothetical protein